MTTTSSVPAPVRAALLTPDGVLQLVDVVPHPDAIAKVVDAAGPVTARATWVAKGGDVLTVWTAATPAPEPNDLALRVVDELLLPMAHPQARDRIREAVTDDPIAGAALVTGYRPRRGKHEGATVGLSELAVEMIRATADGRRARRELAGANETPTEKLPVVPATSSITRPASSGGSVKAPGAPGGVADLQAKLTGTGRR